MTIIGEREAGWHGFVEVNGGHMDVMIERQSNLALKVGGSYLMDLVATPLMVDRTELPARFFPATIIKRVGDIFFILKVEEDIRILLGLEKNTLICHRTTAWNSTLHYMVEANAPLVGQAVEFQLGMYNGDRCAGYTKPVIDEEALRERAAILEIWAHDELSLDRVGYISYCEGGMKMTLRWRYACSPNGLYDITVMIYSRSTTTSLKQYIKKEYDDITAPFDQF